MDILEFHGGHIMAMDIDGSCNIASISSSKVQEHSSAIKHQPYQPRRLSNAAVTRINGP